MKRDLFSSFRKAYAAEEQRAGGPVYWRSAEHKGAHASVVDTLDVEFPAGTAAPTALQRRDVLKIGGASLALAGLSSACVRRPVEEILPYTHQPEEVIPGIPNYYATVMPRSHGAVGLVVEAHEGRPTKIEGNTLHPASLGAADIWAQAEVLKLYDPDRARTPVHAGQAATWADWDTFQKSHFASYQGNGGQGLAFVTDDSEQPTFDRVLAAALAKLPNAKRYRWDALAADNAQQGAELAFGAGARVHHDLESARVIFALDSNFLDEGPDHLRLARGYGKSRRIKNAAEAKSMNRLYVAEGVFSLTGSNADHRFRVASGEAPTLLRAVAQELRTAHNVDTGAIGDAAVPAGAEKFVKALAADLAANRANAVILVGERQPAAVHAAAYAINAALGSTAQSTTVVAGAAARQSVNDSVAALAQALSAGQVETLVIFDVNLAHTAPGALKLGELLSKAKTVVHAGVLDDETAAKATWHLPQAHFLESWGDARAWDGTASIVQPLIMPLFGARAGVSLLAQVTGGDKTADRALVEETWTTAGAALADKKAWSRALHDGVIVGSARAVTAVAANVAAVATAIAAVPVTKPTKDALELVMTTGHGLDGRLMNVSWVMELGDVMTKLCWDNALVVAPSLARELGINSGVSTNSYKADVVELTVGGARIEAPVFVLPGYAPYTVGMTRGYGKSKGEVATNGGVGVGADGMLLVPDFRAVANGVTLTKTGKTQELASTQDHFTVPGNPFKPVSIDDIAETRNPMSFAQQSGANGVERVLGLKHRPLYKAGSLKMYEENPAFAHEGDIPGNLVEPNTPANRPSKPVQPTDEIAYDGQQWGMVIDLTSCTGCNACVIACQSENNIPNVGRDMVLLGRELHWMRIDRYFYGDVDSPEAAHQPVNCMHCENAPCEPVCPVSATVHDEEGLNSMAYNRCIGTRYCSNNCPYKVRRFNYFDFTVTGNVYRDAHQNERMRTLKLQRNPNVTVRYRGVMEKCTYCTQRIEEAKVAAKRAGQDRKALPDGAITPACAQTCPTDAIVFGNINDPNSRVAALKQVDRNYEMLQELNVRPRTTFLARLKNTNAEVG